MLRLEDILLLSKKFKIIFFNMSKIQFNHNFKRILIFGKSPKFEKILRSIFGENAEILIIPWRTCVANGDYISSACDFKPDLIVVCGYDYSSSLYSYYKYCLTNIDSPLKFINGVRQSETRLLYVNTELSKSTKTYSRYQYAKNYLCYSLHKNFQKIYVVSIPTVLDNLGNADVVGSKFSKKIFNLFIRFGLIKTISQPELTKNFVDCLSRPPLEFLDDRPVLITPKFLRIRRTLFMDRLMRLFGG